MYTWTHSTSDITKSDCTKKLHSAPILSVSFSFIHNVVSPPGIVHCELENETKVDDLIMKLKSDMCLCYCLNTCTQFLIGLPCNCFCVVIFKIVVKVLLLMKNILL